MRKGNKFARRACSSLSKHRNPLAQQKKRNRQRRHVLYTIHFESK
ncbi:MAG: hypothetical protein ACI4V7_05720 [Succinivibrionaceae bacterium]